MMKNSLIPCLVFTFAFCGCNTEKAQTSESINPEAEVEEVYLIDIEEILKNEVSVKLSEIADTIEYIELKADGNTVIFATQIFASEQHLFVISKGNLYQFTMDGTLLRQIGRRGQGPGEYAGLGNLMIDDENDIIGLSDVQTPFIHYYSTKDGSFLHSHKLPYGRKTDLFYKDSLFYISAYPDGKLKNLLTILNHKHDTLGCIPNYDFYTNEGSYGYIGSVYSNLYTYDNRLFFKGFNDHDTIWELKGTEYRVHAIIDKGKYKSPRYFGSEMFQRQRNGEGSYYRINQAQEDDRYIYITLSPYWNPYMRSPLIMYEKREKKGFFTFGRFENDITGGHVFSPNIFTDSHYISTIEAQVLLDKEDTYINASPSFKNFIKTLNEDSNTILIKAKRKRQ